MLKKYNISLKANMNAAQIADNILKEFSCEISDPSIWLSPGTTDQKGLTFLDNKGKHLDSSIFRNQAFFEPDRSLSTTDEKAIESLIYTILFEHYQFGKTDVKVTVTSS